MNKILVKLYVPAIEMQYDVWLPINRKIYNVITLLVKAINELCSGEYKPENMPMLYDKNAAKMYDINLSVKANEIKNGTEIILI